MPGGLETTSKPFRLWIERASMQDLATFFQREEVLRVLERLAHCQVLLCGRDGVIRC